MISKIRAKVAADQFELSEHAVGQSITRHISMRELQEAVTNGEIIEDYPDDKYGPSCLIFGFTSGGRPLHIHCSHPKRPLIKIITLYEPNPMLWEDFRIRMSQDGE